MTEEIKEEQKCNCGCECSKALKEFFLRAGAVFLGVLLAILVASALLRPPVPPCKCHKEMHGPRAGMERQNPPMMRHHKQFPQKFEGKTPDLRQDAIPQFPQKPNQK